MKAKSLHVTAVPGVATSCSIMNSRPSVSRGCLNGSTRMCNRRLKARMSNTELLTSTPSIPPFSSPIPPQPCSVSKSQLLSQPHHTLTARSHSCLSLLSSHLGHCRGFLPGLPAAPLLPSSPEPVSTEASDRCFDSSQSHNGSPLSTPSLAAI